MHIRIEWDRYTPPCFGGKQESLGAAVTLGYSRSGIYTGFSARLLQLKSLADGHISLSAPPGDGSDDGVPWPRMQAARSLAADRLNATSCARAR